MMPSGSTHIIRVLPNGPMSMTPSVDTAYSPTSRLQPAEPEIV